MSDESRKHVVPTGTVQSNKAALMSSTATTGANDTADATAGIGDFLASKAQTLADARFVQFVTIQTAIACLMFLAEREAYIPTVPYEGSKPKNVGDGSNLNLTLLANACRSDRNSVKDGRINTFLILRNWLALRLSVDDQVATQLLAFCGRLLDMGYGLKDWNGTISMDAAGVVTVAGKDEEHPLSDSMNADHKPWMIPGLFQIKPEHAFMLGNTIVPEVEVCDLVKVRDPNTGVDEMRPYPFETQRLTLCDRSYAFTYGDRSKKRDWKTQRTSRKTFMNVTQAIINARNKDSGKGTGTGGTADAGTGTPQTGGTGGAAPQAGAGTGGTTGGTAPAGGTGTGTAQQSSTPNRPGGNQSREDAAKASRDRIATLDNAISAMAPAMVEGFPDVISAVMRLHLHTSKLLRDLGAVEFVQNPTDDLRKSTLAAFSMSGGKKITPAPTRNPPAKAAPAKATAPRKAGKSGK